MAVDPSSGADSPQRRSGLLRDQVQLVKRKDSDRYEIIPIQDQLSFEKGFFIVIRACQLLAQKNDGIILVGVAGPSGAGKTAFTEKVLNFMPSIAVITMDNYNDSNRIIDGNFDDPRLTDYDTLLENIHDLKAGKPTQVPIYDFKTSSRIGYRLEIRHEQLHHPFIPLLVHKLWQDDYSIGSVEVYRNIQDKHDKILNSQAFLKRA